MRTVCIRDRHLNGKQQIISIFRLRDVFLVGGGGTYARDKNTSAGLCAKNVGGGAYARGGAYLRDTTVLVK